MGDRPRCGPARFGTQNRAASIAAQHTPSRGEGIHGPDRTGREFMGRSGGCELHACLVGPGTARDPPGTKEFTHGGERGDKAVSIPLVHVR